jgi:hypothetical protein
MVDTSPSDSIHAEPSPELRNAASPELPSAEASPLVPASAIFARPWVISLVVAVIACALVPLPSRAGLWDPHELNVAELARRLAVNVFHADKLAIADADPSMPHLDDLGRGELPFLMSAAGFAAFGLREWAGRLPFVLLAVLAALGVHASARRAADSRAAVFAVCALVTMPLFAVQAHALIGDLVSIVAVTAATLGLGTGAFGLARAGASTASRGAGLVLGLVALAAAVLARGVIFGAVVPLASVGLAGLVIALEGALVLDALGAGIALVSGLAAIVLAARAASVYGATAAGSFSYWLGALPRTMKPLPTFDVVAGDLGHALVPWAGLAPFALGRMTSVEAGAEKAMRTLVVVGLGVAYFVHAITLPYLDAVPFLHVPLLALAIGFALRDIEQGARPSLVVAIAAVLLVLVMQHDFREQPDKLFLAFGVHGGIVPEAFKAIAGDLTRAVLLPAALLWVAFLSPRAKGEPFAPGRYVQLARNVLACWEWGVAKGLASLSLMLGVIAVALRLGVSQKAAWAMGIPLMARQALVNLWWAIPLAFAAAVLGALLVADVVAWAFDDAKPLGLQSLTRGLQPIERLAARAASSGPGAERLVAGAFLLPALLLAAPVAVVFVLHQAGKPWGMAIGMAIPTCLAPLVLLGLLGDLLQGSRAAGVVATAALAGFGMNAVVYPKLADQLSPKGVFERYAHAKKSGDEIALLAVGTRAASYYAGGDVASVGTVDEAARWLAAPQSHRRFLVFRGADLARLNSLWRGQSSPPRNAIVLDDRSSEVLLATSALAPGETNANPLEAVLPAEVPVPQRPLHVDLEGKIEVVGLDIVDMAGKPLEFVSPGRKFRMRTILKVNAPVSADYDFFIHMDGQNRRRHNGDHKVAKGRFPTSLWRAGDVVVDDFETTLEPNFGPGAYTIYFGLYLGDQRLKITGAAADSDNRINGGVLRVQ